MHILPLQISSHIKNFAIQNKSEIHKRLGFINKTILEYLHNINTTNLKHVGYKLKFVEGFQIIISSISYDTIHILLYDAQFFINAIFLDQIYPQQSFGRLNVLYLCKWLLENYRINKKNICTLQDSFFIPSDFSPNDYTIQIMRFIQFLYPNRFPELKVISSTKKLITPLNIRKLININIFKQKTSIIIRTSESELLCLLILKRRKQFEIAMEYLHEKSKNEITRSNYLRISFPTLQIECEIAIIHFIDLLLRNGKLIDISEKDFTEHNYDIPNELNAKTFMMLSKESPKSRITIPKYAIHFLLYLQLISQLDNSFLYPETLLRSKK